MKRCIVAAVAALVVAAIGHRACAQTLYGVTGDGASTSETLYELSQTDASSTFVLTLGNGTDGEAIGYNPTDGLIYHSSGHLGSGVIFEKIDAAFTGTTNIDITGTSLEDEEAMALTWDASRSEFLWGQYHDTPSTLYSVTPAGVPTLIGGLDHTTKGLAFVGSTLYSVSPRDDLLRILDASDASTLSSLSITMPGTTVDGATGLAAHPGTGDLWAVLKTSGGRRLATIDATSGVASDVGLLSDSFAGLAFTALIPEPSTLLLLALGAVGLLSCGRRRRRG